MGPHEARGRGRRPAARERQEKSGSERPVGDRGAPSDAISLKCSASSAVQPASLRRGRRTVSPPETRPDPSPSFVSIDNVESSIGLEGSKVCASEFSPERSEARKSAGVTPTSIAERLKHSRDRRAKPAGRDPRGALGASCSVTPRTRSWCRSVRASSTLRALSGSAPRMPLRMRRSATALRDGLHISNTDIGLLVAVTSRVAALATLPFGVLADRVAGPGARRVIVMPGAAMLWSASVGDFNELLLARECTAAAYHPPVASLIGDYIPFRPSEAGSTASSWRAS